MKIIALFSGGKDSTYALHEVIKQGHQVLGLLTVISKNPYSYMFHYPCINLTSLQAEALNIPIYTITSEGRKEEELDDL